MKKLTLLLTLFLSAAIYVAAQDIIFKKNNEKIECKVIEVGVDEIKYKLPEDETTWGIDRAEVSKIKFGNGKIQYFQDNFENKDMYANQKKNAIKMDFFSPLNGHTSFTYEHSMKPGMSLEGGFSIIGLGRKQEERSVGGMSFKAGIKFIRTPDFYLRGQRYAHILKGAYVRPELIFGLYNQKFDAYRETYDPVNQISYMQKYRESENIAFASLMINFGKQFVFSDIFLIDYYFGIGYGVASKTSLYSERTSLNGIPVEKQTSIQNFACVTAGSNFPLSFTAGLRFGILLK